MPTIWSFDRHLALTEGFSAVVFNSDGHALRDGDQVPEALFRFTRSDDSMTAQQWDQEFTAVTHGEYRGRVLTAFYALPGPRMRLGTIRAGDPFLWERSIEDGPFQSPIPMNEILIADQTVAQVLRDGGGVSDSEVAESLLRVEFALSRPQVMIDGPPGTSGMHRVTSTIISCPSAWVRVTDGSHTWLSDCPYSRVRATVYFGERPPSAPDEILVVLEDPNQEPADPEAGVERYTIDGPLPGQSRIVTKVSWKFSIPI